MTSPPMPPLDHLDRITAGHPSHASPSPSPERPISAATSSLDGGVGLPPPRATANPTPPSSAPRDLYRHPNSLYRQPPSQPPQPSPSYPTPSAPPPAYFQAPSTNDNDDNNSTNATTNNNHTNTNNNNLRRRRLLRWLYLVHPDVLAMLLLLALTYLIMRFSRSVFGQHDRVFPMHWDDGSKRWYGPVELSREPRPFVLSVLWTGAGMPAVGVAVVVGMQVVGVRSWWDVGAGVFGVFKGLVMM